jgi:hypothetical protein
MAQDEALSVLDPATNSLGTANAIAIEGRFHHLGGRHKKAIDLLKQAASLVAPIAEQDSVTSFATSVISTARQAAANARRLLGRRRHEPDRVAYGFRRVPLVP